MLDNIYSIIDSKIQYLLFELNSDISRTNGNGLIPHRGPQYEISEITRIVNKTTSAHKQEMLQKIEASSTIINRLLMLRSKLTDDNIEMIYNLITHNYYLEFTRKELRMIVDGKQPAIEE